MDNDRSGKKGYEMEEHLRNYFNKSGYYVIRGVPFNFGEADTTDIDLWIYTRSSSLHRNISVVDIKNKKAPKAMERLLWVYGLKKAVQADNAIIATTDKRQLVKDFGQKLSVQVLDGNFLNKLKNTQGRPNGRVTEEQFFDLFSDAELAKLDGDWKSKLTFAKSFFSSGISYNTCNALIEEAQFFANKIIETTTRRDLATRCFYLLCSYISICIDYLLKDIAFLDHAPRTEELMNGFTYGSSGKGGTKKTIENALSLVEQYSDSDSLSVAKIRTKIERDLDNLGTNILAEYFSKPESFRPLVEIAKELELAAYQDKIIPFSELSLNLKSQVFVFLDFWKINRTQFIDKLSQ
jgi:hypothetical protein